MALPESINQPVAQKEAVICIFLDLAKAFNSISHKIFL